MGSDISTTQHLFSVSCSSTHHTCKLAMVKVVILITYVLFNFKSHIKGKKEGSHKTIVCGLLAVWNYTVPSSKVLVLPVVLIPPTTNTSSLCSISSPGNTTAKHFDLGVHM